VTRKTPATSASKTASFKATFSEPVTGLTSSTMRLYVSGRSTPVSAKVTLSSSARVATLNPNANLVKGKTYTLKLSKGIKDGAGNLMAATSWKVKAK
jgi:hypothetical protein